jgi:Tfp pilus assembly protein PilO
MRLNVRNLDRLCLTMVILFSLGCIAWSLYNGVNQYRAVQQENERMSREQRDLNLAEANLQNLKAVLHGARDDIRVLNERIPESAKIGKFLKQLDVMIKARKITLITVLPQTPVKGSLFTKTPIRLVLSGSFPNLYRLLYDLETMNRLVMVEKLLISKPYGIPECRAELTALVYDSQKTSSEGRGKL